MMTWSVRWAVLPVAGALLLTGCGKDDAEKARFNEVLGGRGPLTVSGVDLGILQDPGGYKPANAGGSIGGGAGGDAKPPSGADAGVDADAAKKPLVSLFESITLFQAAGILDSFDETQVAALKEAEFESKLTGVLQALQLALRSANEKSPDAQKTNLDEVMPKIAAAFRDSVEIKPIDEKTASASVNSQKLVATLKESLANFVSPEAWSGVPEGSGDTAGGGVPLKLTADRWHIELPSAVTKPLAEHLNAGCVLGHEYFTKVSSHLDSAAPGDDAAIKAAWMAPVSEMTAKFLDWYNQLMAILNGTAAEEPEKPADTPKADDPANSRIVQP